MGTVFYLVCRYPKQLLSGNLCNSKLTYSFLNLEEKTFFGGVYNNDVVKVYLRREKLLSMLYLLLEPCTENVKEEIGVVMLL